MELQPPQIQTVDAACQYDPEPEPEPEPAPRKGKKGKRGKKGKGKGKRGTGKGKGKKGKGEGKGKENVLPEPPRRRGSADEEAAIKALAIGNVTPAQPEDLLPSPMRTEAEQLLANREAQDSASMGLRLSSPAAQSAAMMHSPAAGAPAPLSAW
jgi:hypothetical protein